MKYLTMVLLSISLIACGGEDEESDYEMESQLCQAQDGIYKTYFVEDMESGDQFIVEQCELPESSDCQPVICKKEPCPQKICK